MPALCTVGVQSDIILYEEVMKLIISMVKVGKFFIVLILCENILKFEGKIYKT